MEVDFVLKGQLEVRHKHRGRPNVVSNTQERSTFIMSASYIAGKTDSAPAAVSKRHGYTPANYTGTILCAAQGLIIPDTPRGYCYGTYTRHTNRFMEVEQYWSRLYSPTINM